MKIKGDHIVCIARLIVKPEYLDTVKEALADLMRKSPKEKGCLRYELHQNIENPLEFTFVDRFKNQDAFELHCQQDYAIKYFDQLLPPLVDELDIRVYHEIEL